jgi:hypothetical protein
MPSVDMPLSRNGVKGLIANLKQLARELRDDVVVDIERGVGEQIAEQVRANIANIYTLDGNYDGGENPGAAVRVFPMDIGHGVIWSGSQIAFLEFGTGAAGAADPYPGPAIGAAGYHPDGTKDQWWYDDARLGLWLSLGLPPLAPMLNAATEARVDGSTVAIAGIVVKGALGRAVALH